MYFHIFVKRVQTSRPTLSILRRHYWTQGKGPNYSTNMIVVGIATVLCAAMGVVSFKLQQHNKDISLIIILCHEHALAISHIQQEGVKSFFY